MIFQATQAGLSFRDAAYNLPPFRVFDMLACYWESLGLQVERIHGNKSGETVAKFAADKFDEILAREKQWQLAQL